MSILSSHQPCEVLRHREVQGPVPGHTASAGQCTFRSAQLQSLHPGDVATGAQYTLDSCWKALLPTASQKTTHSPAAPGGLSHSHRAWPPSAPRRGLGLVSDGHSHKQDPCLTTNTHPSPTATRTERIFKDRKTVGTQLANSCGGAFSRHRRDAGCAGVRGETGLTTQAEATVQNRGAAFRGGCGLLPWGQPQGWEHRQESRPGIHPPRDGLESHA